MRQYFNLFSAPVTRRRADGMLLLATFFWGWTFPVIKEAIAVLPVFAFLCWRFGLSALLMAGVCGLPGRAACRRGLLPGLLLFLSFAFQTLGLAYTSASNCAFITGLSIVWVALATGRGLRTWAAAAPAVGGLWLLTAPDKGVNIGDWLTLVASVFIAWHIIVLDKLDKDASGAQVAMVQFAVVGGLSLAASLLAEERQLPQRWDAALIIALAVSVAGATLFAFWAQTHYQRYTTAARTALIFMMEPVFAAAIAVLFFGEILPAAAILGAALVLGAMLFTLRR